MNDGGPPFQKTKPEKVGHPRKSRIQNRSLEPRVSPQSFNSGEPVSHSEVSGPLAGGVKDTKDFNGICADSIGNDVGCVANDQLART